MGLFRKALATNDWVNGYPNVVVNHVVLEGSDDAMLLLSTKMVQPRRKRQFMYDPRCNQDERCDEVVRQK